MPIAGAIPRDVDTEEDYVAVTGEAAGERRAPACPTSRRWRSGSRASTTSSTRASPPRCSSALRLPQPLLLEGEAGVGKTEAAKALAAVLDTPLIRLQCYEGIDAAEALYEWNYPRQLLSIRLADAQRRRRCARRTSSGPTTSSGGRCCARSSTPARGRPCC